MCGIGFMADRIGIHHAFVLPVICHLYILLFAAKGQPKQRVALRGSAD
jgi:fucose permease